MSNATDNPRIEVLKAGGSGVFTNYIYKAIPLAFDESMSYYETLAGLRDYLEKTVIPTVNNNADAVAELQGLYEKLNEYVDNYFNNLDVQEEINNKLDDLVADGTLTRLIGAYVQPLIDEQNQEIANFKNSVNSQIASQNVQIQAIESGSPLVASSTAGMTDTTRVYVNTTDGNWYYYNGSAWTIGGIYQATKIENNSIGLNNLHTNLSNFFDIDLNSGEEINIIWDEGHFYNGTDGAYVNNASTKCYSLPVNNGDIYIVEGRNFGTAYPALLASSSNPLIEAFSKTVPSKFAIIVPNNAEFLRINSHISNNITKVYKVNQVNLAQNLKEEIVEEAKGLGGLEKWYAIGDSITEKNYRALKNYVDYVEEDLGIEGVNLGLSSSGFKQPSVPNFTARLDLITNYKPNTEVITVMGGTNDRAYSSQPYLGSLGDTTMDTYYGALYIFFTTLFQKYPACRIGLITPTPVNPAPETYPNLIQAQIETANKFNVPVLNLFYEANLRPDSEKFRQVCFKADGEGAESHGYPVDGVHPNTLGHKLIANRIKEFVRSL